MKFFLMMIYSVIIKTVYANFNVTYQNPNGTFNGNMHEFTLEIDHEVNPPKFQAHISIYNNSISNTSLYQLDASNNTNNITYNHTRLIFYISDNIRGDFGTVYYITLDEGVLFSNTTLNSTARMNSTFWNWKYVGNDSSTPVTFATTTIPSNSTSNNRTDTTLSIGESSPTRSAQLGIGLGITFIIIGIIIEIIYFKYCYRGHIRSGNYLA